MFIFFINNLDMGGGGIAGPGLVSYVVPWTATQYATGAVGDIMPNLAGQYASGGIGDINPTLATVFPDDALASDIAPEKATVIQ